MDDTVEKQPTSKTGEPIIVHDVGSMENWIEIRDLGAAEAVGLAENIAFEMRENGWNGVLIAHIDRRSGH